MIPHSPDTPTPGETAYVAYTAALPERAYFPAPAWTVLDVAYHRAWEAAAQAVRAMREARRMFVPSTLLSPIVHPLPYGLFLFDADGTLRETVVEGQRQARPPNKPGEWQLLPRVQDTLRLYDWRQRGCAIVSNQGGVGLGYMTESMARFLLQDTLSEATGSVVGPHQVWMCPHKPDAGCPCRKPGALLLEQAQMPWHSQGLLHGPDGVLFVGDQDSDWQAAATAGIDFCWATDFFGWEDLSHA